jgi:Flp pilus assembly protein TadD
MMRGLVHFRLAAALAASALAAAIAPPAAAQGSYSPYDESPAAALARYVRELASDPKDFDSLIGAGKAALELGDAQAAAGFFARADDVNPRSPLPQAGMGAVSVANGEPQAALPYFKRAQQLGLPISSFACDRGLAYDLMGQQSQAQSDYRLALAGRDAEEARRRLALSLAISGDRNGALEALAPLSAKGDSGVARVRAFVLALTGDSASAMNAINAAMPGTSYGVAPLLQRLPALSAAQKAAAVNFGIFPDSSGVAYASAAPVRPISTAAAVNSVSTDRLSGIDALLRPPAAQAASAAPQTTWHPPVQLAYAPHPASGLAQRAPGPFQPGIWLQLASGSDVDSLSEQFRRMRAKNPDVFQGIKPYIARSGDGARLVVGPFRGNSDADTFSEDLETIGVEPLKWSNSQADRIAPLPVG